MIDIALMIVLGRTLLDSNAINGGVTTDSGSVWDVLTGAGVRDVTYTIITDPESLAEYRLREKTLKALRG